MEALFELDRVAVRSGDFAILEDINLQVPLGKVTFLMGPAGSGKSTLIKVMAGLVPPDSGSVRVSGKDYRQMARTEAEQFRAWTGFVFQDAALWSNMSILDNVMMPLLHLAPYHSKARARERALALIRRMGYKEDVLLRPADLSAGEQKLIGFARALMNDPLIHFMDSPFDMIDTTSIRRVINLVLELKRSHRTLVVVSDRNDFCCEVADHVYVLELGRLVAGGSLESLAGAWPSCLEPLDGKSWQLLEKRGIMTGQGEKA